ncbi:hypothetical protein Glove_140g105 [Diversispora epigaea]|uniref:Uncharacterized protein n=1 Tax=Diversispora epigaea TaxID=1348612 RepID=A0A397J1N8_9GLOM|nr:hypothetical protein Glove_140g105 [Diversispora epigaea]
MAMSTITATQSTTAATVDIKIFSTLFILEIKPILQKEFDKTRALVDVDAYMFINNF